MNPIVCFVSFLIAVLAELRLVFDERKDVSIEERGMIFVVLFVFIIVTLIVLFKKIV